MKAFLLQRPHGDLADTIIRAETMKSAQQFCETPEDQLHEIRGSVATAMGIPATEGRYNGALIGWIKGPTDIYGEPLVGTKPPPGASTTYGIYEEIAARALTEFERQVGSAYKPEHFSDPRSVPENIRRIVSRLKVYEAEGEQGAIHGKLLHYSRKPLPQDLQHLLERHNELQEVINFWAPYAELE